MITRKLVVLDYNDDSISIWDVSQDVTVDDDYIQNLGFHLSEVSWKVFDFLSIHFHKRILT